MKNVLKKAMGMLLVMALTFCVMAPEVEAAKAVKVSYSTYSNMKFLYQVSMPTQLVKTSEYSGGYGANFASSDGSAKATVYCSYMSKKRTGKNIVAVARKSRKITIVKQGAKECQYYFAVGSNIIHWGYVITSNGEIAVQITYPKSQKAYYATAMNGIMKSAKKNKKLTDKH